MPDLATISAALSSIRTATDLAKFIKDSGTTFEQAEYKLKLAELVSALADAKVEIASIQDVLLEKDREIESLKEDLELKANLIWQKPYYWTEKDGQRDGPFCQQCYDNSRKLIRLQGDNGLWTCNTCKVTVTDDSYRDPWSYE